MAETSGPRGPCTAPRRRCCPAWRWTATAWAQPRPDACLPRACRARCRPESTWLASISTRTRVSALRRAPAHACPPGILGREAPEILMGLFPGVRDGVAAPPFLGRGAGERAVSAAGAGGPLGPRQRPVRRRRRRAAALRPPVRRLLEARSFRRSRSHQGRFQRPSSCGGGWDGVSKIWARKGTSPTPFEISLLRVRVGFLANSLAGGGGPQLHPQQCGVCGQPGRPPAPGSARRTATPALGPWPPAGGPRPSEDLSSLGGEWRPQDPLTLVDPGPGAPSYSGGKAGARRGGDAETGSPPSRSWGHETAWERIGPGRGRTSGLTSSHERRRPGRPDSPRRFRRGAAQARGGRRLPRRLRPLQPGAVGRESRGPPTLPPAPARDPVTPLRLPLVSAAGVFCIYFRKGHLLQSVV